MDIHSTSKQPIYIVLISIHGLLRSENLELGRDADTGGQTKYVIELARALAERPDISRVELLTRRIEDPHLSPDYAKPVEPLSGKASIVRLDAGPGDYIRKEELWDYLDNFADNALDYLRANGEVPHIIHSHYADAGYVGTRLANFLGVPLVHTGHSLGRVKRRRLLAAGVPRDKLESHYHISRRIAAEEETLSTAMRVITSTSNEIESQYGLYDHYQPDCMRVVPPGTDLARFHPPHDDEQSESIALEINRFLREPDRPMILALSRPDERKNISTLIKAYGESTELQQLANLVIIAGNRDDIDELEEGAQRVITEMLALIDQYDLYGHVAYPKHHLPDEVAIMYRLAAASKGVFINPALTEPFGLTLLEATASGLPVIATEDGGPQDIIGNCNNGFLIDPLDSSAMAKALLNMLSDAVLWQRFAQHGIKGVQKHYSWRAHVERYLHDIQPLLDKREEMQQPIPIQSSALYHDRGIFTDLDQNLLGDPESLAEFLKVMRENRINTTFGIITGRPLESALMIMRRYGIPQPDVLITSVGTQIFYAPQLTADLAWVQHIDFMWQPAKVRRALSVLPGLKLQPKNQQGRFKISYYIDPKEAPDLEEINSLLHQNELSVNCFLSFGQYLDIVPVRASKGFALRFFADQWGIPLEHILAAGGSGTDEDMILGNTLAAVVANRHDEELSHLSDIEPIYFAKQSFARGILEAIEHYDFFGACQAPEIGGADV